jgi:hypothetical protein
VIVHALRTDQWGNPLIGTTTPLRITDGCSEPIKKGDYIIATRDMVGLSVLEVAPSFPHAIARVKVLRQERGSTFGCGILYASEERKVK